MDNFFIYPDGRVNARDAAQYLGLSEKTLAMWRCQGTGPRYVKRGRIFYYLKDLDAWLEGGKCTSTAQARVLHLRKPEPEPEN